MTPKDTKLKILNVSPYFDSHVSGLDLAAGKISRGLAALGHSVVWAASDSFEAWDAPGVELASLHSSQFLRRLTGLPIPLPTPAAMFGLIERVNSADLIIVHNATSPQTVLAILAAKVMARPVMLAQHGGHPHEPSTTGRALLGLILRVVVPALMRLCTRVVFSGHSTSTAFGLQGNINTRVIFNGIDANLFKPGSKSDARLALSIVHDRPVILFVGRFVFDKGIRFISQLILDRTDIEWLIVGVGPLRKEFNEAPHVRLYEAVPQHAMPTFYHSADVVILPSQREGFPLVVKETLACGCPLICSSAVASADPALFPFVDMVDLTDHSDTDGAAILSEAIDRVLAGMAYRAHRIQEAALFAANRYSWENCSESYEATCLEMMNP